MDILHFRYFVPSLCLISRLSYFQHWVPPDPDVQHCRVNLTFRHVDSSLRQHKSSSHSNSASVAAVAAGSASLPSTPSGASDATVTVPSSASESKIVVLDGSDTGASAANGANQDMDVEMDTSAPVSAATACKLPPPIGTPAAVGQVSTYHQTLHEGSVLKTWLLAMRACSVCVNTEIGGREELKGERILTVGVGTSIYFSCKHSFLVNKVVLWTG